MVAANPNPSDSKWDFFYYTGVSMAVVTPGAERLVSLGVLFVGIGFEWVIGSVSCRRGI